MGSSVLKPLLETWNFSSSSLSSASPWPSLVTTVITTKEEDTVTEDTTTGRETLRPSQSLDTMDITDTITRDMVTAMDTGIMDECFMFRLWSLEGTNKINLYNFVK